MGVAERLGDGPAAEPVEHLPATRRPEEQEEVDDRERPSREELGHGPIVPHEPSGL
jgi:hypothetical protein